MEFNSLTSMIQTFDTEEKCIEHLAARRWPGGTICPHCSSTHKHAWIKTRKVWWCKSCKKQFSVKVGTIFEGSLIKLQKWFMAVWLLTSHKKGISSHQLARDIAVTQKSAWFILSRLRLVATRMGGPDKLFDVVEVDETYVGGKERNKHLGKWVKGTQGRGSGKTKDTVPSMVGRGGKAKVFKVQGLKGKTVHVITCKNV